MKIIDYLKYWSRTAWEIGIVLGTPDDVLKEDTLDIHIVKHTYKDRWFADPFVLDVTEDRIKILVEELFYSNNKGRISLMDVDRATYQLLSLTTVFELDSHLSFPCILRKDGLTYIYPENGKAFCCKLYQLDEMLQFKYVSTLSNESISDAVLYEDQGHYYMFATKNPHSNDGPLFVYEADRFDGEYKACQTIQFADKVVRNAGKFISIGEDVIRPVQDCTHRYGEALVFQKLCHNDEGFSFTNYKKYLPPKGFDGLHTFNHYRGVCVVDCHHAINPLFSRLFYGFVKKVNSIKK